MRTSSWAWREYGVHVCLLDTDPTWRPDAPTAHATRSGLHPVLGATTSPGSVRASRTSQVARATVVIATRSIWATPAASRATVTSRAPSPPPALPRATSPATRTPENAPVLPAESAEDVTNVPTVYTCYVHYLSSGPLRRPYRHCTTVGPLSLLCVTCRLALDSLVLAMQCMQ